MDRTDSEARIKMALRVLNAIAVERRFPDHSDSDALRSVAGVPPEMGLDEIACEVIVREVQRMRLMAERNVREALTSPDMALKDCA